MTTEATCAVDLYWLPLGAGGHSVRLNGKVYEAAVALIERRRRYDLYHSALEVHLPEGRYVIESAPVPEPPAKSAVSSVAAPSGTAGPAPCASSATRCGAGVTASSPTSRRPSRARSG